ncbi:acyl-CoA-binding protein [Mesonia sp. K7]|nr:acyl-CoA-binding protein [Mesonia sp. K7]
MPTKTEKLNQEFEEAYERASKTSLQFPPDILLQFYGYYKRATKGKYFSESNPNDSELISAFKMNAIFQVRDISPTQAKREYIKIVNKYIPKE